LEVPTCETTDLLLSPRLPRSEQPETQQSDQEQVPKAIRLLLFAIAVLLDFIGDELQWFSLKFNVFH
jgi:hypothetical protein